VSLTSAPDVFEALLIIGLVLVAAKLIRRRVSVFRRLFFPASVVGVVLALLMSQQILDWSLHSLTNRKRSPMGFCSNPSSKSGHNCR